MADATIHATFGLRGPEDHVAFFRFIQELLREEGTRTQFLAENAELQMSGTLDASSTPEELAARCRSVPIDEFVLPPLREAAHSVSAALYGGLSLMSPSTDWLSKQKRRWLAAGGPEARIRFFRRSPIRSAALTAPEALPVLAAWLIETAGPGDVELLTYDARDYPSVAKFAVKNVDGLLARLRTAATAAKIGEIHLRGSQAEASVTPSDDTSVYVTSSGLDHLLRAFERWNALEGT